jgi:hypothetical protein
MMPWLVYPLCVIASFACALLLFQAYRRAGERLLLWSAVSFVFLAANNVLVFADAILFPAVNMLVWRYAAALAAVGVLIYAFVWEVE